MRTVAILTNQGGLPYGVAGKLRKDGRPYPTPVQFITRLRCARVALSEYGIAVAHLRVSLWHAYADAAAIRSAATQVRGWLDVTQGMQWRVYTTERARKPHPLMLHSVGATEYWGDSPEDAAAAANARIPFVPVERFGYPPSPPGGFPSPFIMSSQRRVTVTMPRTNRPSHSSQHTPATRLSQRMGCVMAARMI